MEIFMADDKKENISEIYLIKVQAYLDTKWAEWFYGMDISYGRDGVTTLKGSLPDQTVLHSVLDRIRDMNLKLISVNKIVSDGQPINYEAKGEKHGE
jgi:hypothetical protein